VVKSGTTEATHTAEKRPATSTSAQPKPPKRPMTENSRAAHEQEESSSNVHRCTVCGCEFNSTKVHIVKPSTSKTTAQPPSDSLSDVTTQDSVSCSVCTKVFVPLRTSRLLQFRSHEVAGMDDVRWLETRTQDTINLNTGLNLDRRKQGDGDCIGKTTIPSNNKRR